MRRLRGFTLIEVLMCLGILAVLFFPLMNMVEGIILAHSKSLRLATLRSEVDRAGFRVQALLRQNPRFTISAGNDGATLAAGQQLRWQNQTVTLTQGGRERTLAREVTHFSLFRRDGLTTLTVELRDPVINGRERKRYLVEEDAYAAARL